MFRNKEWGISGCRKKSISVVEKNVWITERFFDNHYKRSGSNILNPAAVSGTLSCRLRLFLRGCIVFEKFGTNDLGGFWMSSDLKKKSPFPSALESAETVRQRDNAPTCEPSPYSLAFQDTAFLLRDELRPVRLQLELLKPELILQEQHIESTVVIYGSARIPEPETAEANLVSAQADYRKNSEDTALARRVELARKALENSKYYEEARKLGTLISRNTEKDKLVVVTGGGPGIMEAANRGAHEAGMPSIGMNIVLPHEQTPNPFITADLNFQFHYFAIRKMHLLMRAKSLVAFPGGFGTLDELFETLTLIQTRKVSPIPVLLFGQKFWERIVNFDALVEEGTISSDDLELFQFIETAEEAWEAISQAINAES